MSCKVCVHARKAGNENGIGCALWSTNPNGNVALVDGKHGWNGDIFEGWIYLGQEYYDGPIQKKDSTVASSLMTNFCTIMPLNGTCDMYHYKNDKSPQKQIKSCNCDCHVNNSHNWEGFYEF